MKFRLFGIIGALSLLALLLLNNLAGGDWGRFGGGLGNLMVFFTESMWPPDWSVLEPRSYPPCESRFEITCSVGYIGMVETLKIAFASTMLGFIGAIMLSRPWLLEISKPFGFPYPSGCCCPLSEAFQV